MLEIERKFLVNRWAELAPLLSEGIEIRQAYIIESEDRSLRIRKKGNRAFLTLKFGKAALRREEFEYEIPASDAEALFSHCHPSLHKTRYELKVGSHLWEIDVFHQSLTGLIIAEIELDDEYTPFELPFWAGKEVTDDPEYLNINLIKRL